MNVLIANSKKENVDLLHDYLHRYDKSIRILAHPSTVEDTIRILVSHSSTVDLVFFETQLSDGPTFGIINQLRLNTPVIFTSRNKMDAFDAIKVSAVDYLLEPLTYSDVVLALEKVKAANLIHSTSEIASLTTSIKFKKRFIIKFGDKIQYRNTSDISYIFAEGKLAYMISRSNSRKYIIEHTLDELERVLLDPDNFFRINRKFIVNIEVIEEVRNYVNSRLKLVLNPPTEMDMIVSREKVNHFKNWLNL